MPENPIIATLLSDRYKFLNIRPAAWAMSIGGHGMLLYLLNLSPVPQF